MDQLTDIRERVQDLAGAKEELEAAEAAYRAAGHPGVPGVDTPEGERVMEAEGREFMARWAIVRGAEKDLPFLLERLDEAEATVKHHEGTIEHSGRHYWGIGD